MSIRTPTMTGSLLAFVVCILLLAGCDSKKGPRVVLAEEVGIKTVAGYTPLVAAGTSLPAIYEDVFSTASDNQTDVQIQLYAGAEGNRRDLAVFVIDQIQQAPKGKPRIRVAVRVLASGRATIRAERPNSDSVKEVDLGPVAIRSSS